MMQQSQAQPLYTELAEDIFTITLNRPRVLNALTLEMFSLLGEAIAEAALEERARVVVLRGAGGHFCSGADLSVLGMLSEEDQAEQALTVVNAFLLQLHQMNKPVIALIEGVAVGAGLNLALHADFVLAAKDAVLQEPFVQIGLTTDFGGTYLLPRLVGLAQAKRLALLGEKISGSQAEAIGLIYKAVDRANLDTEANQLIAALRKLPKQAWATTKEGLHRSLEMDLAQSLAWEKQQQPALIAHPEFQAVIRQRLSKG
ncbi:enoyl-CoA hydratase/isomerase family protein [Brevibacillus ruminantium]|uniref:Enoyl-CoA hydratase/isomerase family protein n=1 Tax=Brevibacillus ruminantium TaxID=2950604 RepID=A0ABY4WMK9_9BACL|nr:enoyl-CoA hydratase/isomerase family protein [Brevibacillus ruminantium]USG68391.1 enoyl-CoA hydratase/isomerase family protein [Brevibacillus ruminantium]